MKIIAENFNIPDLYNKEHLILLLKNEHIEDVEEIFVKTLTQFKRDLKKWFPNKPKTGSFNSYFKSLEQKPGYVVTAKKFSEILNPDPTVPTRETFEN